ncbi:Gag-Pol polyprotein [Dissostichus eleginoides]|uniref:Gag-Pol polyprotein n=1 Tax=Dissostichus eleginoides TaxID=100907 RepID=A0AAD9C1D1_DISEL|nr:Gag-Pol polyprotein [Dissostichus eleginoides]
MPRPNVTDSAVRAWRGWEGGWGATGVMKRQPQWLNSTPPLLKRCSSRFIICIGPGKFLLQTKDVNIVDIRV